MSKVLIDGATATNTAKQQFNLKPSDFEQNSLPAVKTSGLGTGDSVIIYEWVNSTWNAGVTLDDTTTSKAINSIGTYAVDITMTTGGPASVQLDRSRNE